MSLDAGTNASPKLEAGESVLYREARALLGWMTEPEAIQVLLGHNPTPDDDLAPLRKVREECLAAVSGRPIYEPEEAVIDEAFPGLAEVANRSEVIANFANMQWRPALVDLTKVLSFQKLIHIDGLDERTQGVGQQDKLMEVCIPSTQPQPPVGAFTDSDGKGFTISSYNPNLRIAGGQMTDANVSQAPGLPEIKMRAVTIFVFMGASYLQVVRYRDRCFIRDGYHRAAGLLKAGLTQVPCIFIEARSFEEVGAITGAFTYETLYGEHPPRLIDFWDSSVSRTVKQASVRKVVRVRGEEFVVQR
jgi:hypothetical protein